MIAGIFHQGSGLGNQLFRYVATRVLAADKGYNWGMIYNADGSGKEEEFKGKSFISLDTGKEVKIHIDGLPPEAQPIFNWFTEKKVVENGIDIRPYDPEINFVRDNTIIDGEFQDPRYFEHRLDDVREWLKVNPLEMDTEVCVIGFRGGEYTLFPDLFLDIKYWDKAISMMKSLNPKMRFEVHTDDLATAQEFFPHYPIIQDIGINWRSVRYAKYLIIANSSFYILPALLNEDVKKVIAPRYWARRNTKVWALPQNYYKQFTYI